MSQVTDNESWLIETADVVIRKKAQHGIDELSPWERLVFCVWVVDYGMRNAGDLETARDVYPECIIESQSLALSLDLPVTFEMFRLSEFELSEQYFERFEAMCDELRTVK